MRVIYYALTTFTFLGCSVPGSHTLLPKDINISQYRSASVQTTTDKTKLVHIVKRADNTNIEFWVDPFEDEVLIDFTFSKASNSSMDEVDTSAFTKATKKSSDSDVDEISQKSKDEQKSEANQNNASKEASYSIEDYLYNYENAQALYYAKKYSKSLISVKKAIELNPNVAQGYKLKGTILYTLNRFDEALDAWYRALELNPKLTDVKASIKELESNAQ